MPHVNMDASHKELMAGKMHPHGALVLYHRPSCPFCVRLEPAFKELAASWPDNGMMLLRVNTEKHPDPSIRGVPTIHGFAGDGQVIEYNGDRSASDMLKFANAVCSKTSKGAVRGGAMQQDPFMARFLRRMKRDILAREARRGEKIIGARRAFNDVLAGGQRMA